MVGGSPTDAAFVRELHRTLAHLYDPSELRRARLIDVLRVGKSADPALSVQRLLLQAIEALKLSSSVPSHANAWRIYHILNQRYAGQFRFEDIATNLAISGRQLRRLQILALQTLGDYLWTRYGFKQKPAARDAPPTVTTEPRRPLRRRAFAPRPARALRGRSFGSG